MRKLYKKIFVFLAITSSLFCILLFVDKFILKSSQYTCKEISNGYELTLYNKFNKKIFSDIYPKEPQVKELTQDVLEIGISTGSSSLYIYFFNKNSEKISKTYFNPIIFDEQYVAYMENGKLILEDLFGEGELYKEIIRDFSETANPIAAIISINILDENSIVLEYYSGVSFIEKSESITLFDK